MHTGNMIIFYFFESLLQMQVENTSSMYNAIVDPL